MTDVKLFNFYEGTNASEFHYATGVNLNKGVNQVHDYINRRMYRPKTGSSANALHLQGTDDVLEELNKNFMVFFTANLSNTGNVTIRLNDKTLNNAGSEVNSIGISARLPDGSELPAGFLVNGGVYSLTYDSTNSRFVVDRVIMGSEFPSRSFEGEVLLDDLVNIGDNAAVIPGTSITNNSVDYDLNDFSIVMVTLSGLGWNSVPANTNSRFLGIECVSKTFIPSDLYSHQGRVQIYLGSISDSETVGGVSQNRLSGVFLLLGSSVAGERASYSGIPPSNSDGNLTDANKDRYALYYRNIGSNAPNGGFGCRIVIRGYR